MREILVSRFETFTDDFHFDDSTSICSIMVNTKKQTISFTVESGDIPPLYVILMIMSVNKHWLQIVDNFDGKADMSRCFLLTRWLSFDASDFYLCHEGDNGVPVIDRCLFKCGDDRGISSCILSPLDYLMLVEYDSRFEFSTPKSRLKELREDYGFRYIN
jgi:hypothetical protein